MLERYKHVLHLTSIEGINPSAFGLDTIHDCWDLPTDINDWGIQNTVELIQTNLISNSARNILDKVLKNLDPKLGKEEKD